MCTREATAALVLDEVGERESDVEEAEGKTSEGMRPDHENQQKAKS